MGTFQEIVSMRKGCYGLEYWAIYKSQDASLQHMNWDLPNGKIRNDYIRGGLGVANFGDKKRDHRLR